VSVDLSLERYAYHDDVTLGRFRIDGVVFYTVERPWLGNAQRISCIPIGTYRCSPRRFVRGGYDAIEIRNVPGRAHILFHIGNRATDVEGCIAVCSSIRCGVGEHSAEAWAAFYDAFGRREFELRIENYRGGVILSSDKALKGDDIPAPMARPG
jgi:hypothetical protein